jgi:hypothetical protein
MMTGIQHPRDCGLDLGYRFRKSKESRMYDLGRVEKLYYILYPSAYNHVDIATLRRSRHHVISQRYKCKSAIAARAMAEVLTCSQQPRSTSRTSRSGQPLKKHINQHIDCLFHQTNSSRSLQETHHL